LSCRARTKKYRLSIEQKINTRAKVPAGDMLLYISILLVVLPFIYLLYDGLNHYQAINMPEIASNPWIFCG